MPARNTRRWRSPKSWWTPASPGRSARSATRWTTRYASTIGLFKAEAIDHRGPSWRTRAEVEWQVARWVAWYNATRLHSSIGPLPPVEFEQDHRQAQTVATVPEVA